MLDIFIAGVVFGIGVSMTVASVIFKRSKCRHDRIRTIYGDEINAANGDRSRCRDCGMTFAPLAERYWQHGETGRVCKAAERPSPEHYEVDADFAQMHEQSLQRRGNLVTLASDLENENALKAYDALSMSEKTEIMSQSSAQCFARGWVAGIKAHL